MGIVNTALAGSSGNQGYFIQRSLRLRSSASANLTRTFGSGNQTTSTLSSWIKRGKLGAQQNIMGVSGGGSNDAELYFDGGDTLTFNSWNGGSRPLGNITTAAVFRDPSAWYHIVLVVDTSNATSTERLRLYVNGARQTVTGAYPAQNATWYWNGANAHTIGVYANPTNQIYLDGYLAEVNFIDGQALTPSSFGEFSTETGVWVPKKYTGTYGTNGFYLDFKTNTSPTTLAQDKSGNGNNWTANNISTTAGATYDSMTDVPTLTSATAANYCTWNPLNKHSSIVLSSANLSVTSGTTSQSVMATFGVSSGKWYFEYTPTGVDTNWPAIGVAPSSIDVSVTNAVDSTGYVYQKNGNKLITGTSSAYGASYTNNDVIGVALDLDAGTLVFYKNNVSQGTAVSGLSGTFSPVEMVNAGSSVNFGQRPFSYTPPTGFKALNTFNLPDPVIKKPNQYMDATTYTGTGASNAVVNSAGFQPDLVWLKNRNYGAGTNHVLVDSVRGTSLGLASNLTNADFSTTGNFSSINSNGFTVAGTAHDYNFSTDTFVGWQWKKGATPGFDIVTWTGDGTGSRSVNHSLGVAPKMFITKCRNTTQNWFTFANINGSWNYGFLNTMAAFASTTQGANATALTGLTGTSTNGSGQTYVAYLFAEIPGFSKFGSYTGNGSTDGPFVYCGFRPKYVMYKRSDGVGSWAIHDTSRDTFNVSDKYLLAESSGAEGTYSTFDFTSNGFKVRNGAVGLNASGGTYTYAAFAENPFKYSLAR